MGFVPGDAWGFTGIDEYLRTPGWKMARLNMHIHEYNDNICMHVYVFMYIYSLYDLYGNGLE